MSVKIISITFANAAAPEGKSQILARFDCTIGEAITLRGCSLVKTPRDGFTVWPPRGVKHPVKESVQFVDPAMIAAIMHAARDAYRAMGGTDAEWTPHGERHSAEASL